MPSQATAPLQKNLHPPPFGRPLTACLPAPFPPRRVPEVRAAQGSLCVSPQVLVCVPPSSGSGPRLPPQGSCRRSRLREFAGCGDSAGALFL